MYVRECLINTCGDLFHTAHDVLDNLPVMEGVLLREEA